MKNEIKSNNALLITCLDVSGSISNLKKRVARIIHNQQKAVLLGKYSNVEYVYIAYTTVSSYSSTEEGLFVRNNMNGGTYISSGLNKVLETINKYKYRYEYDIYVDCFGDGDNWAEDNEKTVNATKKICSMVSAFTLYQIRCGLTKTTIIDILEKNCKKFKNFVIRTNQNSVNEAIGLYDDIVNDDRYGYKNDEKKFNDLAKEKLIKHKDILNISKEKDNKMIVILKNNAYGVSKKMDCDDFDFEIGFDLAYTRAKIKSLQKDLEKTINKTK